MQPPRFPPKSTRYPRPKRILALALLAIAAVLPRPSSFGGGGSGPTSAVGAAIIPMAIRLRDSIKERTAAAIGPVRIPRPRAYLTHSTEA